MLKRRINYVVVATLCPVMLLGCATIIQKFEQEVGVSSSPTGASVTINGRPYGKTPVLAMLTRNQNHLVKIEMPDYEPFEMYLTKRVSGWIWGNIVFGGIIGLAIDLSFGAAYILSPDQIMAHLDKKSTTLLHGKDAIYVAVVLQPDPSWQKIGNLTKAQ